MQIKRILMVCLFLVAQVAKAEVVDELPEAVSNNAVAMVNTQNGPQILSFMGLAKGKTYLDVHNQVWAYSFATRLWQAKQPVPSSLPLKGRLASVAVGLGQHAYLFGGYTVAEDHTEISSPDNYRYDPVADSYHAIAVTPVPVDDAIALVYQDRYIYLISGWHNDGNVNLVQVYDVKTDTWAQASPFLGQPVFGHAGGIVDTTLLVCDGVKVVALPDRRRTFAAETACYLGTVDADNPLKIDWRIAAHPTATARYRMAAVGLPQRKQIVFWGGSDNPYNYNGIGYDGHPSEPTNQLWIYDLKASKWQVTEHKPRTMDHRGLVVIDNTALVVGGMTTGQQVTNQVTKIILP